MAGLILSGVLLFFLIRSRIRVQALTKQIQQFSMDPKNPMDFALEEGPMANLQNAVCDLEEALLRANHREAEECSRTSALTADISHQLKTPLTTLRLYAELDESPHMDEELEQIGRMEQLIQSLLRLERLCADGYAFHLESHDLKTVVKNQWDSLSPLFPEKQFRLTGAARLRCDEKWLGEALLNLLKNACEHTPDHGTIRVTLEESETACFCTVEDNGGGVPKEDLSKLFQRFYRARHQSKQGAGIGMAISQEIIRRHHGSISAANGEAGLKISITLPILDRNLSKS